MKIIEQKIITELFNPSSFQHFKTNSYSDSYIFKLNDLIYLVTIVGMDGEGLIGVEDIDIYEVAFGVASKDEKFMDDDNKPINGVFNFYTTIGGADATDVVETVIEIIADHYQNIASGGPTAYSADPIQDQIDGKWTNKRLSLYQRQAKRAAKNRDIDSVSIKTGNSLGDQDEEHDQVYFIFS